MGRIQIGSKSLLVVECGYLVSIRCVYFSCIIHLLITSLKLLNSYNYHWKYPCRMMPHICHQCTCAFLVWYNTGYLLKVELSDLSAKIIGVCGGPMTGVTKVSPTHTARHHMCHLLSSPRHQRHTYCTPLSCNKPKIGKDGEIPNANANAPQIWTQQG